MKTTFRYLAAAFTVIAAVSCAKHEELGPQVEAPVGTYQYLLNVSHENDGTKTTMDGVNILWNADDKIGVSCSYQYVNSEGETKNTYSSAKQSNGEQSILNAESYTPSTSATFVLNIPEGYTPKAIAYPYYADAKATSGKSFPAGGTVIHATIPETQTGVVGNIPEGAFAMVGTIDKDNNCQMRNVGALIKFEIKGNNLTSIKFEGNNSEVIAGNNYYYTNTGNFAQEVAPATSVTLVPSGEVFETGDYYFAVSPNTLADGFTMTLTNSNGEQAIKKTSSKFEIERNHKYVNFGSDEGWFKEVFTLQAGNVGSATGTTATLYGVATPGEVYENDDYGFEISTDGKTWTKVQRTATRTSSLQYNTTTTLVNVFSADINNCTPDIVTYYRAYYQKSNGATTYAKVKSFTTVANAQSRKIDLYNGYADEYWPFSNLTYGVDLVAGKKEEAMNKGTDLTLSTTDGDFIAKATNGFWMNAYNGCLTFKPAKNEYLKFPIVAGHKVVSVTVVFGSVNGDLLGSPSICLFPADGDPAVAIGGGEWTKGKEALKYDSHTWHLTNTTEGQYGIRFNSPSNCYISYLEVVYETVSTDTNTIVQELIFSDGSNTYWPFDGPDKRAAWEEYKGENKVVGPFHTTSKPEITYNFYIANIASNNNWRNTAGRGLRYGGTAGDYMQICPVEDYKLTSIKIKCGNAATSFVVKDAKGNDVDGGAKYKISAYEEYTFTLSETLANTEYRLVLPTSDQSSIFEMTITYELVK